MRWPKAATACRMIPPCANCISANGTASLGMPSPAPIPTCPAPIGKTPATTPPPGGESWNTAAARVSAAVDRLVSAHTGRDLVIVAHFGAILTQVQAARACTPAEVFAQGIDNLSVTRIDHGRQGRALIAVNHCP